MHNILYTRQMLGIICIIYESQRVEFNGYSGYPSWAELNIEGEEGPCASGFGMHTSRTKARVIVWGGGCG